MTPLLSMAAAMAAQAWAVRILRPAVLLRLHEHHVNWYLQLSDYRVLFESFISLDEIGENSMRLTTTLLLLLVVCANRNGSSAPITFSDSRFAEADWQQLTILDTATQGSATNIQTSGGLGDDAYRLTQLHMQYVQDRSHNQQMIFANFLNGATYSPQLSGAIESIEFSLDFTGWHTSTFGTFAVEDLPPGLWVRFALMQGGKFYIPRSIVLGSEIQSRWYTLTDGPFNPDAPTHVGAESKDFYPFPDPFTLDKPDFSHTGEPIHFGYIVELFDSIIYAPAGVGGTSATIYIDNFNVSIKRVPESNVLLSGSLSFATMLMMMTRQKR